MERFIVIFSGLVLPLVCYLVEIVFTRPEIIEEILKLAVVLLLAGKVNFAKRKYEYTLTLGLAFVLTELIFYSINFYFLGKIDFVIYRLISTSFLHLTTFFLIVCGVLSQKKIFIFGSVALSILIHFLYNFILSR